MFGQVWTNEQPCAQGSGAGSPTRGNSDEERSCYQTKGVESWTDINIQWLSLV